jgi:signal transduction histidine kinase/CheY-like chemotaxis protein
MNAELERRVEERTAELAQTNAELEQRVEERTREREAALAQVHEMQKLESLGQLTGGLAHDFNNLLMAILGNLDLLAKKLPSDPMLRRLIDGAIRSAERGAALTKRMLAFARRQELAPEAVDVARLIKGMAEMLQRSIGPAIDITMEFTDRLALIQVDPNQLELALLNLALNARDAMPQGGRLTFGAQRRKLDAPAHGIKPGDYLCVTVTDTGIGMDEATLKRAAEPFFTTKEVGKGTGLGLSMVYGLAAQSEGGTRISSRPGAGTTVELWLPVAETHAPGDSQSAALSEIAAAPPCNILIVDDDPMVAATTAAILEDLGHSVLVASSGTLAMTVIRSDSKIDLVITDHAMPGMTGVELSKHIREVKPTMPIILATGYADLLAGNDPGLPRLSKPYRREELEAMLAAVVGPQPAANVFSINSAKRA